MDKTYNIVSVGESELSATWGFVGENLSNYNSQRAGDDHPQRICYAVKAPDGELAGGVVGVIYWDWLYVDLMWVKEELRGCGYGHRLLTLLEDEARLRGAKNAFLDTFSFQAPDFYKTHGYQIFGELKNFPLGHQRYFLTKQL